MTARAQVLVRSRYRDPEALTAEVTLRDRLGFGDALGGLERGHYFEFEFEDDEATAKRMAKRILAETTLLANPNKEVSRVEVSPDGLRIPGAGILVWDRRGPHAHEIEYRLHRERPDLGRPAARRALLWLPVLRRPQTDWADLVTRMARADARQGGLLANPHSQTFAVMTGVIPSGFLFEATLSPPPVHALPSGSPVETTPRGRGGEDSDLPTDGA